MRFLSRGAKSWEFIAFLIRNRYGFTKQAKTASEYFAIAKFAIANVAIANPRANWKALSRDSL